MDARRNFQMILFHGLQWSVGHRLASSGAGVNVHGERVRQSGPIAWSMTFLKAGLLLSMVSLLVPHSPARLPTDNVWLLSCFVLRNILNMFPSYFLLGLLCLSRINKSKKKSEPVFRDDLGLGLELRVEGLVFRA